MGRRVGIYGVLIVIGLAFQPARAGDRKSARRDQSSAEEILAARAEHAVAVKYELSGTGTARALQTGHAGTAGLRSSRSTGTPTQDPRPRQRQRITLFRMDSKFGDVAVEPVIGKVNGVQFSLGF